jgi:hypothetical protein
MRKVIDFIMSFSGARAKEALLAGKFRDGNSRDVDLGHRNGSYRNDTEVVYCVAVCLISPACASTTSQQKAAFALLGTLVPALAAISGNHHSSRKELWEFEKRTLRSEFEKRTFCRRHSEENF